MKPISKSQEKLLASGQVLFMRYGVRKTTVEEICLEASLSKMTFYKYFKNKMELVEIIRDRLVNEGFNHFDRINKKNIPFAEKIELMSRWRVEFFGRFNREFLDEVIQIEKVNGIFRDRFLENMRKAQDDGEIRRDLSIELIWLVTEKLREISREGIWKRIFEDYGSYQDQLRTIIFKGILTD